MLCIDNTITNVYYNLSSEDHLFSHFKEDIFMMWQNEPSVVIGKHQDVFREVNISYTQKENIKIARRFSGGGTVFHDMGNINLSFIFHGEHRNYRSYAEKIAKGLSIIGVDTLIDDRNSIWLNGSKISGSAQYIRKNRHLFHATLLFSSDLQHLNSVLCSDNNTTQKPAPKFAVSSRRSPVTNINTHLKETITIEEFKRIFFDYILHENSNNYSYSFSENDISHIEQLSSNLYGTEHWTMEAKRELDQNIF